MLLDSKLCRPEGSQAPSWEYHVKYFAVGSPWEEELIRCGPGDLLNVMGSEGWELVSVTIRPKDYLLTEDTVVCFFKRMATGQPTIPDPFDC